MARFRKKPIIVDAVQYFDGVVIEGVTYPQFSKPYVKTLEGPLNISEGDWIITDVNGEKYLCKPDIFAKTYDEIINQ